MVILRNDFINGISITPPNVNLDIPNLMIKPNIYIFIIITKIKFIRCTFFALIIAELMLI